MFIKEKIRLVRSIVRPYANVEYIKISHSIVVGCRDMVRDRGNIHICLTIYQTNKVMVILCMKYEMRTTKKKNLFALVFIMIKLLFFAQVSRLYIYDCLAVVIYCSSEFYLCINGWHHPLDSKVNKWRYYSFVHEFHNKYWYLHSNL